MGILAEVIGIAVLITLVGLGIRYFLKDMIKGNNDEH